MSIAHRIEKQEGSPEDPGSARYSPVVIRVPEKPLALGHLDKFLSETLAGEDVAFFPIAGQQWQIRWGEMKLAIYDEKNGRVIRPTPPPKTRKR